MIRIIGRRPESLASQAATAGPQSPTAFLALLTVCCLIDILKQAALFCAGPLQPWHDSAGYWKLGADVAAGDWWLIHSGIAHRTPVYPWLLGLCQGVFGRWALLSVVLMQHGLELATSGLVAATVWRMTRSQAATLAAYFWCALLTARALFANSILTESWAVFLIALFVWLLSNPPETPLSWKRLTGAAICLGVAILERPSAVALAPALAWAAASQNPPGGNWIVRSRRTTAALMIAAAVVLPWCVRNSVVWGRFTVTVFLGRELWTANFSPWPGADLPIPDTGPGRKLRKRLAGASIELRHNWSVASALSRQGLNDVEVDDLMQDVALQAVQRHPSQAGLRVLARCVTFWYTKDWEIAEADYPSQAPWRDQASWSNERSRHLLRQALRWTPERYFQPMWFWSAMTCLGVAALIRLPRWRPYGILLALLLLGPTVLTAALEIPLYRYRCVLEPVMVIGVVTGAAALRRSFPTRGAVRPGR